MAILLSLPPPQIPNPAPNPNPNISKHTSFSLNTSSRRLFVLTTTTSLCSIHFTVLNPLAVSLAESPSPSKPSPLGVANTKSWFQFYGDGFAIRVPPQFEDIMEPEDFNTGMSLYGDKAKPRTFAARFASTDGSEVLSVVIRPTNQLKITFLEGANRNIQCFTIKDDILLAKYIKGGSKNFCPCCNIVAGGSTLYNARTIKIKEEEDYRTYYFYEFGRDEQHAALVAAVNSGKAIIAGATAPQSKWDDDGVQLRSAAISLTVL